MIKNIFLGSASESLNHLEEIRKHINSVPDTKAVMWNDSFPASTIVFDRLLELPVGFSGALFLLAPDDAATVRGASVKIPNFNLIFEAGIFVGMLGRQRIALATHDGTYLSSDFKGLTNIEMGKYPGKKQAWQLSDNIKKVITKWIKGL